MKRFFRNHLLLVFLGVICVVVSFCIIRGLKRLPDEASVEKILLKDGVRLRQVHYSQGDIHKDLNWKLDAEEVNLSQDNNIVTFRQFSLVVEPKGRPKVYLRGRTGEYSRVTGKLDLRGSLQIHSDDGYNARSEHLVFDEKKGLITTEDKVEISGPFFSLTGKGLFVDLKKEILKIKSNVTTTLTKELLTS